MSDNEIPWSKLTGPEVFTLLTAQGMLERQSQQVGYLFGVVVPVKPERSWRVISYFGTVPTEEERREFTARMSSPPARRPIA